MGAVLIFVISAIILGTIQARSIREGPGKYDTNNGNGVIKEDGHALWHPGHGHGESREEWLRFHGFSHDKWQRTKSKLFYLKVASAGNGFDMQQLLNDTDDSLDNCVLLTEEQVDYLLDEIEEDEETLLSQEKKQAKQPGKTKLKRKITDFQAYPFSMWERVIYWKFDGSHSTSDEKVIRGAFHHWDAQTCLDFIEIPTKEDYQGHHILVTAAGTGCHSFIGRIQTSPQQLNLDSACLLNFGTSVHEIGHALGMWHEQQRSDRDSYIRVLWENLGYYVGQFYKQKPGNTVNNVQYDYASVMHYGPKDGSKNDNITMETTDPLLQHIPGQRTGASYLDVKSVNLAYCQASCSNSLPLPCQHDGYQDPNDCSRCRCPPGLTGTYCDQVAPPKQANCGGEIILSSQSNTAILQTPGYDTVGYYKNYQECTWWIKAPSGSQVSLTFEGEFGVYCYRQEQCHHWAEVRYQKDIGLQGPRFCCYNNPGVVLTSDIGEMLVVFQANDTQKWTSARRGFKARVWTAGKLSTAKPDEESTALENTNWACSFESKALPFCDMEQETSGGDDFDWSRVSGTTPSATTGPLMAQDGKYYIFIEASKRMSNDRAVIYFPPFDTLGKHCVSFYYNMYGFHIRTLQLTEKTGSSREPTIFWERTGEVGLEWQHMKLEIEIQEGARLSFVGITGDEYSGDIALDNVSVTSGECNSIK